MCIVVCIDSQWRYSGLQLRVVKQNANQLLTSKTMQPILNRYKTTCKVIALLLWTLNENQFNCESSNHHMLTIQDQRQDLTQVSFAPENPRSLMLDVSEVHDPHVINYLFIVI